MHKCAAKQEWKSQKGSLSPTNRSGQFFTPLKMLQTRNSPDPIVVVPGHGSAILRASAMHWHSRPETTLYNCCKLLEYRALSYSPGQVTETCTTVSRASALQWENQVDWRSSTGDIKKHLWIVDGKMLVDCEE